MRRFVQVGSRTRRREDRDDAVRDDAVLSLFRDGWRGSETMDDAERSTSIDDVCDKVSSW